MNWPLSRPFAFCSKCLPDAAGGLSLGLGGLAYSHDDILGAHSVTEVGVDDASLDPAVSADHQSRRDRQEPAAISLEMGEVDAEAPIHVHDPAPDPEDQPQIQGIAEIHVGQHAVGDAARRL